MTPDNLKTLADRIDPEKLWQRGPFDDTLTQEQRDRRDAGINLRRYATELGIANKERAQGAMYIRGYKLERHDGGTYGRGCGTTDWHRAINIYAEAERTAGRSWPLMMYLAKLVANEVPRMILLFERERKKGLPSSYKMCAHDPSPATPLPDNHLSCALGVQCRACPHLAAIDAADRMPNEAKDEAKAWTCATHILLASSPDTYLESFVDDKSAAAFDERLARSLGAE